MTRYKSFCVDANGIPLMYTVSSEGVVYYIGEILDFVSGDPLPTYFGMKAQLFVCIY